MGLGLKAWKAFQPTAVMKKLFNILITITVVIFMAAAALLVISSFDIPGVPLDARAVLTGSMEPALPTGSIVFVYPKAEYREGDIITFKRLESSLEIPITHRIVEVQAVDGQTSYVTKGDDNEWADTNPVLKEEVYGKVVWHLPYLGRLLDLAKTPWGFAVLIIVPAILVIVDEMWKIIRYMREKKPEDIDTSKKDNEN